ncbi:hypothetical protein KIPB_000413 [Kipferlia bialata]|uniref:AAA+ ATPase domain-containing protein n=1 Tax=Kipferlia bialata TaxID=797122 RepID=A0A391NL93_9EUKA|nr:hypothetical protein KIPB_000413 [Kipferlia bialata]|eukprot:g413.t1
MPAEDKGVFRQSLLKRYADAWDEALGEARDARRLIIVSGQPGVGKTCTMDYWRSTLGKRVKVTYWNALRPPSSELPPPVAAWTTAVGAKQRPRRRTKGAASRPRARPRVVRLLVVDEGDVLNDSQLGRLIQGVQDSPDRVLVLLSNDLSSFPGLADSSHRIQVPPYEKDELKDILTSVLPRICAAASSGDSAVQFSPVAVSYLANKVACGGGDCRMLISAAERAVSYAVSSGVTCVKPRQVLFALKPSLVGVASLSGYQAATLLAVSWLCDIRSESPGKARPVTARDVVTTLSDRLGFTVGGEESRTLLRVLCDSGFVRQKKTGMSNSYGACLDLKDVIEALAGGEHQNVLDAFGIDDQVDQEGGD